MAIFIAIAVAAGFGHHRLYTYLHHRPADGGTFDFLRNTLHIRASDQSLANFFGNQIAKICVTSMSAAIGCACTQVFWWTLRRRSSTLREIDTVDSFSSHPLNSMAWPALRYMTWVGILTIIAFLADQLSSLTPGALTVASTNLTSPCSVPTADLSNADLSGHRPVNKTTGNYTYGGANGRAVSLVTQVLMAGTYSSPPSPCGICTYNVSFVAPAVQCRNVTQTISAHKFRDILPTKPNGEWTIVWWADYDASVQFLPIASRNIEGNSSHLNGLFPVAQLPVIALNCTGWNATYHVTVDQGASSTVTARSVEIGDQLSTTKLNFTANLWDHQILALWDAFAWQLRGTVRYHYTNNFGDTPSYIAWGAVVRGSRVGIAWHWAGNLEELLPQIMHNVSLSLLSGTLSDDQNTTLTMVNTNCSINALTYVYEPARLLGIYIGGLAATLLCLLLGLIAIKTNDNQEESLAFSRILAAYPRVECDEKSVALTLDTPVRIPDDAEEYGRFETN